MRLRIWRILEAMNGGTARRLVLHVGTEKTGTTSIQTALADSREDLARAGILFPKSLGPVNHTWLVAASLDDGVFDNVKAHVLASKRTNERRYRRAIRRRFRRELERNPNWRVLVVSSELVHSRLTTPSEIERLLCFFAPLVDEITVVMCLRRQDRLAVSRFSSVLRAGYAHFDGVFQDLASHCFLAAPPDRVLDDMGNYYDYRALIERFTPHLDRADIRIATYSGDRRENIERFFQLAGLPFGTINVPDVALNPSLSADAQYVLSRINGIRKPWLPNGLRDKAVKEIHAAVEAELKGKPRRVPRSEAEDFCDRFRASNEWVRERYFPQVDRLFDEDFSDYPERTDYHLLEDRLSGVTAEYLRRLESLGPRRRRRSLFSFAWGASRRF